MSIPIVLFDGEEHQSLLPLTYTKPVSALRIGIFTIKEKWEKLSKRQVFIETKDYLKQIFPAESYREALFINSSILPNENLLKACLELNLNEGLEIDGKKLVYRSNQLDISGNEHIRWKKFEGEFLKLNNPWDIFNLNDKAIQLDIQHFFGKRTDKLPDNIRHYGDYPLVVEDGAIIKALSINTEDGPVYIGKNAEIMEGAVIRGPFALLDNAVVKMGAKIYGATTIGPYSKVGGELNNVVIQGFSNKAHDGFLGNSVIGEWCNLGADTNNSNLKNNYSKVKMWSYRESKEIDTGLQFCGLIMGDHSKCGINTMFNTGTVVGVSANIFGSGFPPKFIPSFSWGGDDGLSEYKFEKALETMSRVYERRKKNMTTKDEQMMNYIFDQTKKFRNF